MRLWLGEVRNPRACVTDPSDHAVPSTIWGAVVDCEQLISAGEPNRDPQPTSTGQTLRESGTRAASDEPRMKGNLR
jgi:hypothetical protein